MQILLRQHFTKMQTVYTPGNLDKFLIGLATQPSQNFDNYFTEEVFQSYSHWISVILKLFSRISNRSLITCLKNKARVSVWI